MAISVREIFNVVGINDYQTVSWGNIKTNQPPKLPGIYIIELPTPLAIPAFDDSVLIRWFQNSEGVLVNDQPASILLVNSELHRHWKAEETILYIGQAANAAKGLNTRLNAFHRHNPGNKGPHTGGYWIKLLNDIPNLVVHYAHCENAHEKEFKMLMYFAMKKSGKDNIFDIENIASYLPFANLKVDINKSHNINGAMKN